MFMENITVLKSNFCQRPSCLQFRHVRTCSLVTILILHVMCINVLITSSTNLSNQE